MKSQQLCLLLSIVVLILAFVIAKPQPTAQESYGLTCPDPMSYLGNEVNLSMREMSALNTLCKAKELLPDPSNTTIPFDTQVQNCMTSCYPQYSYIRSGREQKVCEQECQDRTSAQCLSCVSNFHCQVTEGDMFPMACTVVPAPIQFGAALSGQALKDYEDMLKSI